MVDSFTKQKALEIAGIGAWQMDVETGHVERSDQVMRILGLPDDHVINGTNHLKHYVRKDAEKLLNAVETAIKDGTPWDLKLTLVRECGDKISVRSRGHLEPDAPGGAKIYGIVQSLEGVDQRLADLEMIFDNLGLGINVFDEDGALSLWNQHYSDLFDKKENELFKGMTLLDILERERDRGAFDGDPDELNTFVTGAMARGEIYEQCVPYGDNQIINIMNLPLPKGGWVCVHRDISEAENLKRKLEYAANYDQLTELLNRHAFEARCEEIIASGDDFVLVVIDLDNFKPINDQFGHLYGDELLKLCANRLSEHFSDMHVGRLGGDEFAAIFKTEGWNFCDVETNLKTLKKILCTSGRILGKDVDISASIGASLSTGTHKSLNTVFHEADMAMYKSKDNGGGEVHIFDNALSEDLKKKDFEKAVIIEACKARDFEFFFQPVEEINTGKRIGFELLLRWNSARDDWYSTPQIIEVAESNNLIEIIGDAAITTAMTSIKTFNLSEIISVNVSPLQLGHGRLLRHVEAEIERLGINPEQIEIELTETSQLEGSQNSIDELLALKNLGMRIALDDFGTGFATLNYLQMLPFDRIKVDRTFVKDVMEDRQSIAIVSAIFTLAKNLGMTTTAEGIETSEQYDLLKAAGTSHAQGFLLGEPAPLESFVVDAGPLKTAV